MELTYDNSKHILDAFAAARAIDCTTKEGRKKHYNAMKKIGSMKATGLGIEYNGDNAFKKKARRHQAEFRVLRLGCNTCYGYGVNLVHEDMKAGKNFFDGFNKLCFIKAQERYPEITDKVYGNMLRSEHIPINLFVPLNENSELFVNVMNIFLGGIIKELKDFKIEFAPGTEKSSFVPFMGEAIEQYLNDHTSFDAYFEFIDTQGQKCAAGIEIKYTEKEYGLQKGSHQEEQVINLFNNGNLYYKRTNDCGIYTDTILSNFRDQSITNPQKRILTKDRYRQFWRNHMLGESMVAKDNHHIDAFYSMLFYPKGNKHFEETASEYMAMLARPNTFIAKQYEDFFDAVELCLNKSTISGENKKEYLMWLQYLRERYTIC